MTISTTLSDQSRDILLGLGGGATHESLVDGQGTITFFDVFSAAAEALDCATAVSHIDTFEALRAWRSEQARVESLPAYYIFSDRTLLEIAQDSPSTVEELADCRGVGQAKLDKYGQMLLAVIAETSLIGAAGERDPISPMTRSVLQWTSEGHSVKQIVQTYPSLGTEGVCAAYAEAAEKLSILPARATRRGPDASTLPEAVSGVLGLEISVGLARFEAPGWSYQGFAQGIRCQDCDGPLHIFRKPYESAGKQYRYWGIVCVVERLARELRAMDADTKRALRQWSDSSPWTAG